MKLRTAIDANGHIAGSYDDKYRDLAMLHCIKKAVDESLDVFQSFEHSADQVRVWIENRARMLMKTRFGITVDIGD